LSGEFLHPKGGFIFDGVATIPAFQAGFVGIATIPAIQAGFSVGDVSSSVAAVEEGVERTFAPKEGLFGEDLGRCHPSGLSGGRRQDSGEGGR